MKGLKRAAAVSASALAILGTALTSPAQANGEVTTFRINYGSSYLTGKLTWYNHSVKYEGKIRVASKKPCLDAWLTAEHNSHYAHGSSDSNCGSGNYAYNGTIPFKHEGGPATVRVDFRAIGTKHYPAPGNKNLLESSGASASDSKAQPPKPLINILGRSLCKRTTGCVIVPV